MLYMADLYNPMLRAQRLLQYCGGFTRLCTGWLQEHAGTSILGPNNDMMQRAYTLLPEKTTLVVVILEKLRVHSSLSVYRGERRGDWPSVSRVHCACPKPVDVCYF